MDNNIDDRYLMKVEGLSQLTTTDPIGLVQLLNEAHTLQLIVPCDGHALHELKLRMCNGPSKSQRDRFLPEVFKKLIDMYGIGPYEIEIYDVKDGEYQVSFIDAGMHVPFAIRCSDALILATAWQIPIYVLPNVMNMQATPYLANATKMPVPINVLSQDLLEAALQDAIKNEDYEKASYIRDQIKALEKTHK